MDDHGPTGWLGTFYASAVQITEPDNDQNDHGAHPGAERGKIRAHAAGEPLQPQVQLPDVGRRHVLPCEVLELQEVGMMEVKIREIPQHASHVGNVAGWQQGQRVPIPVVVDHLAG